MSGTDDTVAPVSAAPAQAASKTFDTVAAGVAELQRRTDERRNARRAEKAEREDRVAEERKAAAKTVADMEADLDAEDGEEDADPRKVKKPEAKEPKEPKAKAESKEVDADEADDEDTDEAEDDVSAEDDDDGSDGDTDDDSDDKTLKKPEKLKVGDTEVEIPKGTPKAAVEAIKSLQKRLTSDYTKKTKEVAQGRQALAQRAQSMEEHSSQVMRAQEAVVALAEQMVGQPPPLSLAQEDIQQYTIQKALYEQRVAQLQGLGAHANNVRQQQQQQREQQQREHLAEESERMVRVMPRLADPQARQEFMTQAVETARRSGFTPDDVAAVGDHRMLHLLARLMAAEARNAAQEKAGSSVKTKLANVPPKVPRGGNTQPDQGKGERARKAQADFMRSKRSLADVRAFLEARGG